MIDQIINSASAWLRLPAVRVPAVHPGDDRIVTLDIPAYAQINCYCCGATAGFAVVRAFHPEADFGAWYAAVAPHPDRGTSITRIKAALRQSGVGLRHEARLDFTIIRRAIDDGFPILTCVRNGDSDHLHWVVVYGYGTRPSRVVMGVNGIPVLGRYVYPYREFASMIRLYPDGLICWGVARKPHRSRSTKE